MQRRNAASHSQKKALTKQIPKPQFVLPLLMPAGHQTMMPFSIHLLPTMKRVAGGARAPTPETNPTPGVGILL